MQPTVPELSERARAIFRNIVESYIETGAPVGSRTLSKLAGLGLSAASIRNVMQDLEELGLLSSPHTSAGRMPTELGLRLFVDGMMQTHELSADEQARIEAGVWPRTAPIEELLAGATQVLSGLSHCAGVVFAPKTDAPLRQLSFAPLGESRALAILVHEGGTVENRVVELPPGAPPETLIAASNYVNARLAGLTLSEAAERLRSEVSARRAELDALSAIIAERGLAVWSADGDQRPILIVRGQANLLDPANVADLERARLLLEDLEEREDVARVLEVALASQACKVFIGAETRLFSLSGSSVIAAPYRANGRVVGVVGVIGPVRLNYARIVPLVDFTAITLSRLVQ
ncbi:MAG: heat-inducible transcriptional repressor HrcA [Sphingomonadaceae bacterium]|nr:heat-inducible transcriptional repressor HrcA [Sphingomonadaceae bacterium]